MIKLDVKVVFVDIDVIEIDGEVPVLLKFADLFRKMKHLENFSFSCDDFDKDNPLPMEKLTDIPIKRISTWNFVIKKDTIKDVAKILSQMKHLEEFDIGTNFDEDYYLSVEDFALFKQLPVNSLYLAALDIRKDNVDDFRQIMREMKIEYIEGFEDLQDEGIVVYEQSFGPGDRYVTI